MFENFWTMLWEGIKTDWYGLTHNPYSMTVSFVLLFFGGFLICTHLFRKAHHIK